MISQILGIQVMTSIPRIEFLVSWHIDVNLLYLQDQQLAMKCNVEHFGGDTSRITLFGESAGAASVVLHMTNKREC